MNYRIWSEIDRVDDDEVWIQTQISLAQGLSLLSQIGYLDDQNLPKNLERITIHDGDKVTYKLDLHPILKFNAPIYEVVYCLVKKLRESNTYEGKKEELFRIFQSSWVKVFAWIIRKREAPAHLEAYDDCFRKPDMLLKEPDCDIYLSYLRVCLFVYQSWSKAARRLVLSKYEGPWEFWKSLMEEEMENGTNYIFFPAEERTQKKEIEICKEFREKIYCHNTPIENPWDSSCPHHQFLFDLALQIKYSRSNVSAKYTAYPSLKVSEEHRKKFSGIWKELKNAHLRHARKLRGNLKDEQGKKIKEVPISIKGNSLVMNKGNPLIPYRSPFSESFNLSTSSHRRGKYSRKA